MQMQARTLFSIFFFLQLPSIGLMAQNREEVYPTDSLLLPSRREVPLPHSIKRDSFRISAPPTPPLLHVRPAILQNMHELLPEPQLDNLPPIASRQLKLELPPGMDTIRLQGNWKISMSAHQDRWMSQNFIDTRSASLGAELHFADRWSITGRTTLGQSVAPYMPIVEKYYDLYAGISYSPNQYMRYSLGLSYGSYMRQNYLQPNLTGAIRLTDQLNMQFGAGALAYGNPWGGFGPMNLYAHLRLDYAFESGVYLFGTARAGQSTLWYVQGMPYGTAAFGGGIGYHIPNAGRVEMGMEYVHNPFSGQYQPRVYVNPIGLVMWLVKKAVEAFED